MKLKSLFLKELKQEKAWFMYIFPGFVVLELLSLLLYKHYLWQCFGLSMVFILVIFFTVIFSASHSLMNEWKFHTSQFLFSLPIRSWHILLAKFVVHSIIFIIFSFIAFFTSYLIAKGQWGASIWIKSTDVVKLWLIYLSVGIPTMCILLFPRIVSNCFIRFRKLIASFTGIVLFIGFFNFLLPLGLNVFSFLPEASFKLSIPGTEIQSSSSGDFFPVLVTWILFAVLVFIGDCLLLEKCEQG
jgi:ABC-type transport system involved in multi-copper enzyme maturation permease subunit